MTIRKNPASYILNEASKCIPGSTRNIAFTSIKLWRIPTDICRGLLFQYTRSKKEFFFIPPCVKYSRSSFYTKWKILDLTIVIRRLDLINNHDDASYNYLFYNYLHFLVDAWKWSGMVSNLPTSVVTARISIFSYVSPSLPRSSLSLLNSRTYIINIYAHCLHCKRTDVYLPPGKALRTTT